VDVAEVWLDLLSLPAVSKTKFLARMLMQSNKCSITASSSWYSQMWLWLSNMADSNGMAGSSTNTSAYAVGIL
jgi:hypothetical protein